MTVVGIDPSSTRTGYAILKDPLAVHDAGYFRPHRKEDDVPTRIRTMAGEVGDLVHELSNPVHVVVEIPSGLVGARHRGGGSGLTVYGMAVGAIWYACELAAPGDVTAVTETRWTRGETKSVRRQWIAAQFPEYAEMAARDTGGDVSDAIGLALWWFQNQTAQEQLR